MTPLELARQHCANMVGDTCLGLDIGPRGEATRSRDVGPCVLSAGERCFYFETAVLPMEEVAKDDKLRASISDARYQYQAALGQGAVVRRCPDCGRARPRGASRCKLCAKQRRRSVERERKRKTRGGTE